MFIFHLYFILIFCLDVFVKILIVFDSNIPLFLSFFFLHIFIFSFIITPTIVEPLLPANRFITATAVFRLSVFFFRFYRPSFFSLHPALFYCLFTLTCHPCLY